MYADENKKTTKQQTVTLGITDGTYTEITEGLYPGDTILYTENTGTSGAAMMVMEEGGGEGGAPEGGGEGGGPGGGDAPSN